MENKIRIFLCISFFAIGKSAFCEPMFIYFNEMMNRTSCIATGTFLGFNGKTTDESFTYYFKVDQYLKLDQKKFKQHGDTLELSRAYGAAYLQPGTKCVAFINETGGFEWYGVTKQKNITDQSIIFIEGFYDWNAYIVSPCMLSINQLKDYIKDESYSGSVYGDVHFFSNTTKQMEPSSIQVEATYSYKDGQITHEILLNGITLKDFSKKPGLGLPWHYEEIVLEYEPNLGRPLEIKGKIKELHPGANRWHCYFWVEEPEELTYDEFVSFINDPHKGHAYYELEIKMDPSTNTQDNKTYQVLIHDEIGRVGKLIGYTSNPLPISSLSTAPKREIVFENGENNKIILTLDSLLLNKDVFEFAGDDLVRELKISPVQGTITLQGLFNTVSAGRCTVSYKATHFARY